MLRLTFRRFKLSTTFGVNFQSFSKKATIPVGKLDQKVEIKREVLEPELSLDGAFEPFPNNTNPLTGEVDGPTGPEPTRYGDWERKGRCSDF
ncbi:hypothetical protein CRM22_008582 [Opisthorchis felineus]|uniref:Succinate dehydrogenase assembly factor 4, mitochondrial n=1 Tax=Opisthorchis felineus TaxID=147828 RepID=A0A4V3SDE3_OPIFE|nr:hypothetical protein CRM22_008582 [Opisthorchis felineus]